MTRWVTPGRAPDPRLLDAAITLALFGVLVLSLAVRPLEPLAHPATALAYLSAAVVALPYAVHRRHPRTAIVVTAIGVIVYSTGHFNGFPGWSVAALVLAMALHNGRNLGVAALLAGLGNMAVALALQPQTVVSTGTWISVAVLLAVAWVAGETLRAGQDRWTAAEERAQRLAREREERARQAVADERLRIARELHDVVAHSMSVIAVQAGVAHHVIDSKPELAREALSTVETASRSALVEMRRLLGVLRQGDEPQASLTPAPGLSQIPQLAEDFARAGVSVAVSVQGDVSQIPAGVDLSGYRIVQEALTNVLRHGGPSADVTITSDGCALTLEVTDPGPARNRQTDGTGHGLIGMRERAMVFGGTLRAEPEPDGGFAVMAQLPLAEPGRVT